MTTKQRAGLRSMANTITPILQIGKDGVNDNIIQQAIDALEARELIKATVLQNAPLTAREACGLVCAAAHAEPVQVIGNRFVIYKRSEKHPRIDLRALL